MTNYKIFYLKSEQPSFKWNDGLFALLKQEDNILSLCKINKQGKPERYDNGELSVTCVTIGNKGLSETNLTLQMQLFYPLKFRIFVMN